MDVLCGLGKWFRAGFRGQIGKMAGLEGNLGVAFRRFAGFDRCLRRDRFGALRNKANFLSRGFRFFLAAFLLEFAKVVQVAREGAVGRGVITQHQGDAGEGYGVIDRIQIVGEQNAGAIGEEDAFGHFEDEDVFGGAVGLMFLAEVFEKEFEIVLKLGSFFGHEGDVTA